MTRRYRTAQLHSETSFHSQGGWPLSSDYVTAIFSGCTERYDLTNVRTFTLYTPLITIYTICLNIPKLRILPTQCIRVPCEVRTAHAVYLCVPYGSHSKQLLFPHSINRFGSVMEIWCSSCEVRTTYTVSVCSVRFSQPTATVSPHSFNRLGSVMEIWCSSCEVRTAHSVSVCSVRFSQQTATVSPQY
jgi:hypothetical protein